MAFVRAARHLAASRERSFSALPNPGRWLGGIHSRGGLAQRATPATDVDVLCANARQHQALVASLSPLQPACARRRACHTWDTETLSRASTSRLTRPGSDCRQDHIRRLFRGSGGGHRIIGAFGVEFQSFAQRLIPGQTRTRCEDPGARGLKPSPKSDDADSGVIETLMRCHRLPSSHLLPPSSGVSADVTCPPEPCDARHRRNFEEGPRGSAFCPSATGMAPRCVCRRAQDQHSSIVDAAPERTARRP